MKKPLPICQTDEDTEAFVAEADLTQYAPETAVLYSQSTGIGMPCPAFQLENPSA